MVNLLVLLSILILVEIVGYQDQCLLCCGMLAGPVYLDLHIYRRLLIHCIGTQL